MKRSSKFIIFLFRASKSFEGGAANRANRGVSSVVYFWLTSHYQLHTASHRVNNSGLHTVAHCAQCGKAPITSHSSSSVDNYYKDFKTSLLRPAKLRASTRRCRGFNFDPYWILASKVMIITRCHHMTGIRQKLQYRTWAITFDRHLRSLHKWYIHDPTALLKCPLHLLRVL